MIPRMECRVCGIQLDESEIQCVIANFKEYVGDNEGEKELWKQSIEIDNPDSWD